MKSKIAVRAAARLGPLGPQIHQLGRLGQDAVEGLKGETTQAPEIGKRLFRPIYGIDRLTSGTLRGDERGRGNSFLGFGCFEVDRGVDHACESTTDDALTFACGGLIKIATKVGCVSAIQQTVSR